MPAKPTPYASFAERMERAFNRTPIGPGRGRVTKVAAEFGVSRETSRLWFAGVAMPELQRLIEIAHYCDVGLEWLATGREPSATHHQGVRDGAAGIYSAGLSDDEQAVVAAMRSLQPHRRRGLVALLT